MQCVEHVFFLLSSNLFKRIFQTWYLPSEMVKQKFEPGALVFGKVKGYPPWPARVTAIASKDRWN